MALIVYHPLYPPPSEGVKRAIYQWGYTSIRERVLSRDLGDVLASIPEEIDLFYLIGNPRWCPVRQSFTDPSYGQRRVWTISLPLYHLPTEIWALIGGFMGPKDFARILTVEKSAAKANRHGGITRQLLLPAPYREEKIDLKEWGGSLTESWYNLVKWDQYKELRELCDDVKASHGPGVFYLTETPVMLVLSNALVSIVKEYWDPNNEEEWRSVLRVSYVRSSFSRVVCDLIAKTFCRRVKVALTQVLDVVSALRALHFRYPSPYIDVSYLLRLAEERRYDLFEDYLPQVYDLPLSSLLEHIAPQRTMEVNRRLWYACRSTTDHALVPHFVLILLEQYRIFEQLAKENHEVGDLPPISLYRLGDGRHIAYVGQYALRRDEYLTRLV